MGSTTAALALIAVSVWLYRRGRKSWFTIIPAIFMVTTTMASLIYLLINIYLPGGNIILIAADILLLCLAIGVMGLSLKSIVNLRRQADNT